MGATWGSLYSKSRAKEVAGCGGSSVWITRPERGSSGNSPRGSCGNADANGRLGSGQNCSQLRPTLVRLSRCPVLVHCLGISEKGGAFFSPFRVQKGRSLISPKRQARAAPTRTPAPGGGVVGGGGGCGRPSAVGGQSALGGAGPKAQLGFMRGLNAGQGGLAPHCAGSPTASTSSHNSTSWCRGPGCPWLPFWTK